MKPALRLMVAAATLTWGCAKVPPPPPSAAPGDPAAAAEPGVPAAPPAAPAEAPAAAGDPRPAAAEPAAGAMVAVTPEGARLDPVVKPEQIPSAAWYCDMGTVHYARGDKGDGKCPVCKMDLKQKP